MLAIKSTLSFFSERGAYFKRLCLTAFFLFFVPFVIFFRVFFWHQITTSTSQILEKQQAALDNAMERLDAQLSDATKINGLIAATSTISDAYRNEKSFSYQPYDLYNLLNMYCNANDLFSDIYLYYTNERWMYGRSSIKILQSASAAQNNQAVDPLYISLNGQSFRDAILAPEFLGRFNVCEIKQIGQPENQCVLYSYPVYKKDSQIQLLCIVEMKLQRIIKELSQNIYNEFCSLLLLDTDGAPICVPDGIDPQAVKEALQRGERFLKKGWIYYSLQSTQSNSAGWTAVLLTDIRFLTNAFFAQVPLYILILCLLLGGGLAGMVLFVNKNYAPLYDVYKTAQDYVRSLQLDERSPVIKLAAPKQNNELLTIHHAIDNLLSRVLNLSNEMDTHVELQTQELWMDVIHRKVTESAEFERRANKLGINTQVKGYRVMVTENDGIFAEAEEAYKVLNAYIGKHAQIYMLCAAPLKRTPWLIAFPCEGAAMHLELLRHMGEAVMTECEVPLIIGFSNECTAFDQIGGSYLDAFSALEFCHVTGKRQLFYDEIDALFKHTYKSQTIVDLFSAFSQAIKEEDITLIHESLDHIATFFDKYNCPIYNIRHICFELHNIAVETLTQAAKPTQLLTSANLVTKLSGIHLLDDALTFIDNLDQLIQQCMCIKPRLDINATLELIQSQYTDPGFSFSTLAANVSMTSSMFTRIFKAHTGKLPIDYLTELRIQQAKLLLTQTDMPVLAIMEAVGYFSPSSFTKRFKAVVGMTPREYRQKIQQGSETSSDC